MMPMQDLIHYLPPILFLAIHQHLMVHHVHEFWVFWLMSTLLVYVELTVLHVCPILLLHILREVQQLPHQLIYQCSHPMLLLP